MHLMTTTEGHFLRAEARKGECGAVRIWLQFDDCSLILSPEEAPALIGALADATIQAARLEPLVFDLDLAAVRRTHNTPEG